MTLSTWNLPGWVKPAVIPRQTILYGNRLIRKHLTRTLASFMNDFEFQRILCQVGYYGPACTTTTTTSTSTTSTTSTTTTTTTTAGPVIFNISNTSSVLSVTNVTVNGIVVQGISFPVAGNSVLGHCQVAANATVIVSVTGAAGTRSVDTDDSNLNLQCQNYIGAGNYTFTAVECNTGNDCVVDVQDLAC